MMATDIPNGALPDDDSSVYEGRRRVLNMMDDPGMCTHIVSEDYDTGIQTPCGEDEWNPGTGLCAYHDPGVNTWPY